MKDYVNYIVLFIILILIGLISVNLYTNSKFRDDVNIYAQTMKNTKEKIPATNQIYTPTKIVTENSPNNNQENSKQQVDSKGENTDTISTSKKENTQPQEKSPNQPETEEKNSSANSIENFTIEINNN